MNSVYQQLRSNFEADTAYQGADVLAAILGVIKVVYNSTILSQHLVRSKRYYIDMFSVLIHCIFYLQLLIQGLYLREIAMLIYIEIIFVNDMQFCETNIFFSLFLNYPFVNVCVLGSPFFLFFL